MFRSFTVSGLSATIADEINNQFLILDAANLRYEVVSTSQSQCVWEGGEVPRINVTVTVTYRIPMG